MPTRRRRQPPVVPALVRQLGRSVLDAVAAGDLPRDTQIEACVTGNAVLIVAWGAGREVGRWRITG